MLALVVVSVLVGAFAQRITGMGFALVVSPALVIILGPFDGVLIVNMCALLSSGLIIPRVWKHIEWRTFVWLTIPAVIAIIPGSLIAANLSGPPLQIGVGVLVVVALTTSLVVTRTQHTVQQRPAVFIAGAASGFMNTAAGVGGPALSVYAVLTRWPQAHFAATLQPYFVVIGATSLVTKIAFSGGEIPQLDAASWAFVIGALLAGLGLGELLHKRISHHAARIAVIWIAYLGGAAAIVDGLLELVG